MGKFLNPFLLQRHKKNNKNKGSIVLVQPLQRKINLSFLSFPSLSFSSGSSSSTPICSTKDMVQIHRISPKASTLGTSISGSKSNSGDSSITYEAHSDQYPSPVHNHYGRNSQQVTLVLPLR